MYSSLSLLRKKCKTHDVDGVLIPHQDRFQGEYLIAKDEWLGFLSRFTGSAGFLAVLTDKAALFIDGRYTLQAKNQVDQNVFELHPLGFEKKWVEENIKQSHTLRLAYDPWVFTERDLDAWKRACGDHLTLFPMPDFLEDIWENRPKHPQGKIFEHPIHYAGQLSEEKISELRKTLKGSGDEVDLYLLGPESWHWLLNVRGSDLEYSPVSQGFAVVLHDEIHLFLGHHEQDLPFTKAHIHPMNELLLFLNNHTNKVLGYDPSQTPSVVVNLFPKRKILKDPIILAKACKNKTEIEGAVEAHTSDGIAWMHSWHDIEESISQGTSLTELQIADIFYKYRSQQNNFHSLSFPSIVSSGPHGAIVHYKADEKSDRTLKQNELLLIDSGGQYLSGTTDITRVLAIGTPTNEMKEFYTRVLKGHIAIATAIFPEGTSGAQLDALARLPLWQTCEDYAHGTGHGVGSFLSVHEGPQGITKIRHEPLRAGMILSNEPGYYKEGAFGIRIENLVYVSKVKDGWLGFKQLTCVPFEAELIQKDLLTKHEVEWINTYHSFVRDSLASLLPVELKTFLEKKTAPLSEGCTSYKI